MTEHREVASYNYVNEQGELLYEVVRLEPGENGKSKTFRQRRVLQDGSIAWGLSSDTRRVLYNLPSILGANEIVLCCGEKDCGTAQSLGFNPTTNSGGEAVKWIDEQGNRPDWIEPLRAKKIIFFPDCDEAGRKHADDIIEALDGIVASLAIVWVPRGKDLTDFMTVEGGTNEELNKLIEVASLPSNSPVRKLRELIRRKGNPAAIQSEKLVLGAVMEGKVQFTEIDLLDQMDFHVHAHRKIYSSLKDLNQKSGATDLKSVIQELEEREQLDEIGGMTYLVELTDDLPAVFDVDSHLETIKRKTAGRELLDDLTKASNNLIVGADPDEVKAVLAGSLDKTVQTSKTIYTSSVSEIAGNFNDFFGKRTQGIMCRPIDSVMEGCYGLHEGVLLTVGGRPSSGKSSLASLLAAYSAKDGNETELISLEVGKEEALLKILCMIAKVSMLDVIAGRTTDSQQKRLRAVYDQFLKLPLRIDDSSDWTVAKLRSHLKKRRAAGKPVRMLIWDYLQLADGGRQDGRRDLELGKITRGLKLISKEFKMTVVLLSQLSRDMEKMNRRPQLSDLRDSGSIEADSDMVWFTWQDLQSDDKDSPERAAEIIVAKTRNGPIAPYEVRFAKPYALFYETARISSLDYQKLLS